MSSFFCKRCLNQGKFSNIKRDPPITYEIYISEIEKVKSKSTQISQNLQRNFGDFSNRFFVPTSRAKLDSLREKIAHRKSIIRQKREQLSNETKKLAWLHQSVRNIHESMSQKKISLVKMANKLKVLNAKLSSLEQEIDKYCNLSVQDIRLMFQIKVPHCPNLDMTTQCSICDLKFILKPSAYSLGLEPTQENHASVVYLVLLCRVLAVLLDCPLPAPCRRIFCLPRSCTLLIENVVERDRVSVLYQHVCQCIHLLHRRWTSTAMPSTSSSSSSSSFDLNSINHANSSISIPSSLSSTSSTSAITIHSQQQFASSSLSSATLSSSTIPTPSFDLSVALAEILSIHKYFPFATNRCIYSTPFILSWFDDLWDLHGSREITSAKEHWNLTMAQSASLSKEWEEINSDQLPDAALLNDDGSVTMAAAAAASQSQSQFIFSQTNSAISRVFSSVFRS